MKVYEQLSSEQLEGQRKVLIWMLESLELELAHRAEPILDEAEADQLDLLR